MHNKSIVTLPLVTIFAITLAITPLQAGSLADFDACYSRMYSTDHLNAQPKQNLINMQIAIHAKQNSVTVAGTTRDGFKGITRFYCEPNQYPSHDIICCTFECDSTLQFKEIDANTILITVRNGAFGSFASDEDEIIYWEGNEVDNSILLDSDQHYSYKLFAATNKTCSHIE